MPLRTQKTFEAASVSPEYLSRTTLSGGRGDARLGGAADLFLAWDGIRGTWVGQWTLVTSLLTRTS